MAAGGGGASQRDGSDWAGVRGYAGAELEVDTATTRKGRRKFQAYDGKDQEQSAAQARARGKGCSKRTSIHADHAGRGGQCRRKKVGGEGASPSEFSRYGRERTSSEATSDGDA